MPDQFDWASHTEAVAADIFGEPNEEMSRPPDDVRFGNHGSVSVNYMTGQWYDFENERGGGIKELIHVYKEIDDRDAAIAYAEECQQNFENGEKPRPNGNAGNGQPYQREVEATYSYYDASGQLAFEVVRFVFKQVGGGYVTDARGKRKKTFSQRRPSGESGPKLAVGARRRRIYAPARRGKIGLGSTPLSSSSTLPPDSGRFSTPPRRSSPIGSPICSKAVAAGQTICIAEGEKKVDLIRGFGFPATCCAGGAKKWRRGAQPHSCRAPTLCCCRIMTLRGANT